MILSSGNFNFGSALWNSQAGFFCPSGLYIYPHRNQRLRGRAFGAA